MMMHLPDSAIVHVPGAGYSTGYARKIAQTDMRLENWFLTAKSNIAHPRSAAGVTPFLGVNKAFPGHPLVIHRWFRSWRVTFQEFDNGTITAQVAAGGGNGLTYHDADNFCAWLEATYPTIPLPKWDVANWEWHRDFPGFRLEGANSVTLQAFLNVWFKFYNKPGGLRTEMRVADRMPVSEAMALFAKLVEEFEKRHIVVVREVRDG